MNKSSRKKFIVGITKAKLCPYCGKKPVRNERLNKYICPKCGASVTINKFGKPMGCVAPRRIKEKRVKLHRLIQPLIEVSNMTTVYKFMAKKMGTSYWKLHISHLSEIKLDILTDIMKNVTIEEVKKFYNENK